MDSRSSVVCMSRLIWLMKSTVQGVYWDDNGDGSIQVQHVDGFIFHCKSDCTVVIDSNLRFGNAKDFVMTLREQNRLDYRWQHEEVL